MQVSTSYVTKQMAFPLQHWPGIQQPPTRSDKHGLNSTRFSPFCINLILQKKISARPDLSKGLNEPKKQKQIQLQSDAVTIQNRNVKVYNSIESHKAQETNTDAH